MSSDARLNFGLGLDEDQVGPAIQELAKELAMLKDGFLAAAKSIKQAGAEARESLDGAEKKSASSSKAMRGHIKGVAEESKGASEEVEDIGKSATALEGILRKSFDEGRKLADRLVEEYRAVKTEIKDTSRGVGVLNDATDRFFFQLKVGTLKAAAGGAFSLLKGAASAAFGFGLLAANKFDEFKDSSTSAFFDSERAARGWKTTIGAAALDVDKLTKANKELARSTEFSRGEIQAAQVALAPSVNGDTNEVIRLTRLAADVAAQSGKSLGEVLEKLAGLREGKGIDPGLLELGLPSDVLKAAQSRLTQAQQATESLRGGGAPGEVVLKAEEAAREIAQAVGREVEAALANSSAGAGARFGKLALASNLQEEQAGILAQLGSSFFRQSIQSGLERKLERASRLADLLEGARIDDVAKQLVELVASGALNKQIEAVVDALKEIGGELLGALGSALKAGGQILLEAFRLGSVYLESGIVSALRNVPGLGGIKSSVERFEEQKAAFGKIGSLDSLSVAEAEKTARAFISDAVQRKGVGAFRKKIGGLDAIVSDEFLRDPRDARVLERTGSAALDFGKATPRQVIDLAKQFRDSGLAAAPVDPREAQFGGALREFGHSFASNVRAISAGKAKLADEVDALLFGAVGTAVERSGGGKGSPAADPVPAAGPVARADIPVVKVGAPNPAAVAALADAQAKALAAQAQLDARQIERERLAEERRANGFRAQQAFRPAGAFQ